MGGGDILGARYRWVDGKLALRNFHGAGLVDFEMHGQGLCGVGEGSDGDGIDSGLSDTADGIESDSSTGFENDFAFVLFDDIMHKEWIHVIEHDDLCPGFIGFINHFLRLAFHFDEGHVSGDGSGFVYGFGD